MKKILILTLIALTCAIPQTVEEFAWDSTLHYEPLTDSEVAFLDSARLAYYAYIQDEYNFDWPEVYGELMGYWLHDTYDSLQMEGKSWESYDCYLWGLWGYYQSEIKRTGNTIVVEQYSDFEISIGGRHRMIWRVIGRHEHYYPYGKDQ